MKVKTSSKQETVGVVREEALFYEPGDVLLAKCGRSPLWPCTITLFLGYDEEEVQVYQVDFLGTKDYANLETYNLVPITKGRLDRLKRGPIRNHRHPLYPQAIREAELRIARLQRETKDDFIRMGRFLKLYCSDADQHRTFIEVQKLPTLQQA